VSADVLIVVPTLGRRPTFLDQTLSSIKSQSVATDIVIVGPIEPELQGIAQRFGARLLADPGSQTAAIELGMGEVAQHRFVTWLNDDDLLAESSLERTREALLGDHTAVVAYGACDYIDDAGRLLWTSSAGQWAQRILAWGPDLIPQPGMLARWSAWQEVGGLDTSLRFAFDLDLLLRLRTVGAFLDVGAVVSRFRWHAASLTVADRTASLDESEAVKRRYLSPTARRLAWLWERPVRGATRIAAARVTSRARALTDSGR
jgi:GT2 family glycosyltransferase